MRYLLSVLCALCFISATQAKNLAIDPDNIFPKVEITTTMGTIIVELDRTRAPITVDNFLTYVVKGEYVNTIFHRVVADFVVQGGGYDEHFTILKTDPDIVNESGNGLKNIEGTISMARENGPHTANRQFFFNMGENKNLDPGRRWGYAVFGEVVEGMEVLQAIAAVETDFDETTGWNDVPKEPVKIIKAKLLPEGS